jgi:putative intracellular protease/amidase
MPRSPSWIQNFLSLERVFLSVALPTESAARERLHPRHSSESIGRWYSPGVLRHVTYQGAPLVKGKRVTGFTNGEEEEMHLTKVVPFLVEDELMRLGAIFEKKADWQPFSVVDGRLITGQNPASSTVAAQNLVNLLAAKKAA